MRITPLLLVAALFIAACSDDDPPYPSLVTELCDGYTDADGRLTRLELDDGTRLALATPLPDLKENAIYRLLAGYTRADTVATLLSAQSALYLRDSSAVLRRDPTAIDAAWLTPRYLNLRLRPKTQGGTQYWGYAIDTLRADTLFLTLHHRQALDPEAFTTTLYASLFLERLPQARTLVFTVNTYDGPKVWTLQRPR